MSIEFTWLDKQNGPEKIALTDAGYNKIEKALGKLQEKTGLFIDPYSDTRVSPEHSQLLQRLLIDEHVDKADDLLHLRDMLRQSSENSWWILVVGD
jgi:hypothetical protein